MEKLRLIKYPGSKYNYIDKLKPIFSNYQNITTFIDLFGGSASVSLNVEYDKIIYNDIDKNIMLIINAFINSEYDDLVKIYEYIGDNYKNINEKNDIAKNQYYECRNYFNSLYFNSNESLLGLFYFVISAASINSMFRVGPNGFNQGYGYSKIRIIDKTEFYILKQKLTELIVYNQNYSDIIEKYKNCENSLWFLDPPYTTENINSKTYKHNEFDYNKFFENLSKINGNIVYTDYFSENKLKQLNELRKFDYIILRKMRNLAPSKMSQDYKLYECIYYTN